MKIKKIKPELVLGMVVGIAIITLTAYYSIPKKSLMPQIDLIVSTTPKPVTDWQTSDTKDFGLSFEYHSSWEEPVVRNSANERIIYIGPVVITRKDSALKDYIATLKKQKIALEEITLSNVPAYSYKHLNTNKISVESILISKVEDSEVFYEISYSYTKEEEKDKIDKFITSITLQ